MAIKPKILLVEDSPAIIQVMARFLSGLAQLRFATSGEEALLRVREDLPDLVLLDAEMSGMNGYQVCAALKGDPLLSDIPVIFVTSHSGTELEVKGLEIGAADFMAKPISEPLLLARVRNQLRIKQLTDELKRIATVDALTGVLNRRAFDSSLEAEWKRALRGGQPISLLMVDVDHFKLFNDHYGHPGGDTCLQLVAGALRGALMRPGDLVARYGGEEFGLLLPNTAPAGAERMATRVLEAVKDMNLPHIGSPTGGRLTISVGVGCHDEHETHWLEPSGGASSPGRPARGAADLVRTADKALYAAKRAGRARVCLLHTGGVETEARETEFVAEEHGSRRPPIADTAILMEVSVSATPQPTRGDLPRGSDRFQPIEE